MILHIDNNYRLAGSTEGWIIEESRAKKGKRVWQATKWYSSLEEATKNLVDLMVRTSDAQTLTDALVEVEIAVDKLCQALTTHIIDTGGRDERS